MKTQSLIDAAIGIADRSIHPHDVLSGRGNKSNFHAGNKHFRELVRKYKQECANSPRRDKPAFAEKVVDEIKSLNPPGRFLKQDKSTGLWYDIGMKKTLQKARQALREGAPAIRTSSTATVESASNELSQSSVETAAMATAATIVNEISCNESTSESSESSETESNDNAHDRDCQGNNDGPACEFDQYEPAYVQELLTGDCESKSSDFEPIESNDDPMEMDILKDSNCDDFRYTPNDSMQDLFSLIMDDVDMDDGDYLDETKPFDLDDFMPVYIPDDSSVESSFHLSHL